MNDLKLKRKKNFKALYAAAVLTAVLALVPWLAFSGGLSRSEPEQMYTMVYLDGVYGIEATIYHARSGVVERVEFGDPRTNQPHHFIAETGDRITFRVFGEDAPGVKRARISPDEYPGAGVAIWVGMAGDMPDGKNGDAGFCMLSARRQEISYVVGTKEFSKLLSHGDLGEFEGRRKN